MKSYKDFTNNVAKDILNNDLTSHELEDTYDYPLRRAGHSSVESFFRANPELWEYSIAETLKMLDDLEHGCNFDNIERNK